MIALQVQRARGLKIAAAVRSQRIGLSEVGF